MSDKKPQEIVASLTKLVFNCSMENIIEEKNDRFREWVYEFGGTEKLAKAINVHQNSVQNWIARRSRPNLDAVLAILRVSMGAISLKDIDNGTALK